jgi:hypothetical protein
MKKEAPLARSTNRACLRNPAQPCTADDPRNPLFLEKVIVKPYAGWLIIQQGENRLIR